MKTMNFKFNHEKLGNLTATISSGQAVSQTLNIIPATFLVKNKDKDVTSFLYSLYELFAGSNDTMTDIIGEYLIEDTSNMSTESITEAINNKYFQLTSKQNKRFSSAIAENDGIDARIVKDGMENEPLYTAQIVVNKHNGQLVAHIDEQTTDEEYRGQGLMKKIINEYLPIYCSANNISAITLETGAIDGVDKGTLAKIYTNQGFVKHGDLFIKPVVLENTNFIDENTTFEM